MRFLKRHKNSAKAKTGIVLLAIEDIRFHDKVRVSNPFFYESTINTSWYRNWYRNLKNKYRGEFQSEFQLPLASSYYGVSVDKKGN